MARTFVVASAQNLENAAPVVATFPFTMACWFQAANETSLYTLMSLADTASATHYYALSADGPASNSPVSIAARAGGTVSTVVSTASYGANAWHHATAVIASATSRSVYLDGGNVGTSAVSREPAGLDVTTLGARNSSGGYVAYLGGMLAEAAFWDVALDADEVAALGKGASPLLVRPGSLVAYWPLIGRTDPEPDRMGLAPMTLVNAPTVGDHPRIYYPSAPMVPFHAVAAPGGGRIWRLAGVGGGLVGPRGGLVAA